MSFCSCWLTQNIGPFSTRMFEPQKVDGKEPASVPTHVLLPHEIIHALAQSNTFAFKSLLLGNLDDDTRKAFLEHCMSLSPWEDHPVLQREQSHLERLIGVTVHGDGAEMKSLDEIFVFSISSCFAACGLVKDVLLQKFVVCMVPVRFMEGEDVPCMTFKGRGVVFF